jgi:DNA-binding response OmpR family regulator
MADFSILIVDDEPMLAIDLANELENAGYRVVGPATSVRGALALLEQERCDTAILDINLGHEDAVPIAHALHDRNIPFVIVSGYARVQQPAIFEGAPFVAKPICRAELLAALEATCGGAGGMGPCARDKRA